jgi:hypothetical protein
MTKRDDGISVMASLLALGRLRMKEWLVVPSSGTDLLLIVLWLGYLLMRPGRDFYILQRHYFDRVYAHPCTKRGALFASHYEGFDDYLAAKASFDWWEKDMLGNLDTGQQEPEHTLWMVHAQSKRSAEARLRKNKAYGEAMLHQTPFQYTLKSRYAWQKEADEEAREAEHHKEPL